MYITKTSEILEACPTAKFDTRAADKLLRYIEEEEETMLEPLIGQLLMDNLSEDYNLLCEKYGGVSLQAVVASEKDVNDTEKKTMKLLRIIQSALVYRMLANKLYSISTSLNMGAGASRAASDDYEPADDKHMQELRKEYYMNSRRACDNILITLERDAKCPTPVWLELWKESDGFYLKEDLLFPTMRSIRPYIPCDQPTLYVSMCPDIRYCQNTYIAPRIDNDVLESLLDVTATLDGKQKKLQKLLRTALAYYILAKKTDRESRTSMIQTADSAMSTALDYFERNFIADNDGNNAETEQPEQQDCKCTSEPAEEYCMFSSIMPDLNRW